MTLRRAFVVVAVLTLGVPGVSGQGVVERPVWPPPPAAARIRFVRTLDPASLRGRPSMFSRFLTVLAGRGAERRMSQPYGVAVAPDGRVYVADSSGGVIHIYNIEKRDYSTVTVDAESLIGVAVGPNRIYVTDSVSGRVLCLDAKGHVIWTLGRRNGFDRPTGITTGGGRLFVVDTLKNRVAIVSLTGEVIGGFGSRGLEPGQFNFPTNIARSGDGRLFVTDTMNFRVQIFDESGRALGQFGNLGDGSGDFDKPKGIGVDSAGHIYVVEGLNDVVQIFDERGRLLLAFGGSGGGDGQLWLPSGIAISNDTVYVADSANHRIQMYEYLSESR